MFFFFCLGVCCVVFVFFRDALYLVYSVSVWGTFLGAFGSFRGFLCESFF